MRSYVRGTSEPFSLGCFVFEKTVSPPQEYTTFNIISIYQNAIRWVGKTGNDCTTFKHNQLSVAICNKASFNVEAPFA